MKPLFTVLLMVVRPPVFLPFAIETVLAQTVDAFELFIICDGAPPATVEVAQSYARRDRRIKVFPFPKGERNGEAHRHRALADARGRYVVHLCDDDLWFPHHLREMRLLLAEADFGNVPVVYIRPEGAIDVLPGDLALPRIRERMQSEKFNIFGLSSAGYRMQAYRRLPEGWAPAPLDIWSDLHMWRKFLRMDGLKFATRAAITMLHLGTPERIDVPLETRGEENRRYFERIRDRRALNALVEAGCHSLILHALGENGRVKV